jgi:transposase
MMKVDVENYSLNFSILSLPFKKGQRVLVPLRYGDYRTSQTCHACGFINRKLKLTEREWRCPSCGTTLDRDLNAAVNIGRRGKIPCLGEVRPGAQDTDEAVKGNEATTVPILRAEALKST